jgi:hypothetical protein
LILAAWNHTFAMPKMARLAEEIEWAEQHDALDLIGKVLRELREGEWFLIGD